MPRPCPSCCGGSASCYPCAIPAGDLLMTTSFWGGGCPDPTPLRFRYYPAPNHWISDLFCDVQVGQRNSNAIAIRCAYNAGTDREEIQLIAGVQLRQDQSCDGCEATQPGDIPVYDPVTGVFTNPPGLIPISSYTVRSCSPLDIDLDLGGIIWTFTEA